MATSSSGAQERDGTDDRGGSTRGGMPRGTSGDGAAANPGAVNGGAAGGTGVGTTNLARIGARRPPWRLAVGSVLHDWRTDQGLRLSDVAERARVSVQYLSEVERGRKEPSSEVLGAVTQALGGSLTDLALGVARQLAAADGRRRTAVAGPVRIAQVHELRAVTTSHATPAVDVRDAARPGELLLAA